MKYNCCYLCAATAPHLAPLKESFTAHTYAKAPTSWQRGSKGKPLYHLCDRCHRFMLGDLVQCWYWNGEREHPVTKEKGLWVKVWSRSFSWLWQGETLLAPVIGDREEHTSISNNGKVGKPETLAVVTNLPTRAQMREWLVNPPTPPFQIAINQNGQKHVLYRAQTSLSQKFFSIVFEEDLVFVDRAKLVQLLGAYELLLANNFTKLEINFGKYRSDRVLRAGDVLTSMEPILRHYRANDKPNRLLELVGHVAQKPISSST